MNNPGLTNVDNVFRSVEKRICLLQKKREQADGIDRPCSPAAADRAAASTVPAFAVKTPRGQTGCGGSSPTARGDASPTSPQSPSSIKLRHQREARDIARRSLLIKHAKEYLRERKNDLRSDLVDTYLGSSWKEYESTMWSIPNDALSPRVKRKLELTELNLRNRRINLELEYQAGQDKTAQAMRELCWLNDGNNASLLRCMETTTGGIKMSALRGSAPKEGESPGPTNATAAAVGTGPGGVKDADKSKKDDKTGQPPGVGETFNELSDQGVGFSMVEERRRMYHYLLRKGEEKEREESRAVKEKERELAKNQVGKTNSLKTKSINGKTAETGAPGSAGKKTPSFSPRKSEVPGSPRARKSQGPSPPGSSRKSQVPGGSPRVRQSQVSARKSDRGASPNPASPGGRASVSPGRDGKKDKRSASPGTGNRKSRNVTGEKDPRKKTPDKPDKDGKSKEKSDAKDGPGKGRDSIFMGKTTTLVDDLVSESEFAGFQNVMTKQQSEAPVSVGRVKSETGGPGMAALVGKMRSDAGVSAGVGKMAKMRSDASSVMGKNLSHTLLEEDDEVDRRETEAPKKQTNFQCLFGADDPFGGPKAGRKSGAGRISARGTSPGRRSERIGKEKSVLGREKSILLGKEKSMLGKEKSVLGREKSVTVVATSSGRGYMDSVDE